MMSTKPKVDAETETLLNQVRFNEVLNFLNTKLDIALYKHGYKIK